jgi:hypothetical protein
MATWVLHDIRRSVVTHLHELGIAPPNVIEAIVNHVSGHRAGVAGVYNKAAYLGSWAMLRVTYFSCQAESDDLVAGLAVRIDERSAPGQSRT